MLTPANKTHRQEKFAVPGGRRLNSILGRRYSDLPPPFRSTTQKPLDLVEKYFREQDDGLGAVGRKAPQPPARAQPLGHGDHPLPHRERWNDAIDSMRRRLSWSHCAQLERANASVNSTKCQSISLGGLLRQHTHNFICGKNFRTFVVDQPP